MPAPAYVNQTIRLAATFLDADKDAEAGRLLRLLEDVGIIEGKVAFNVLAREYGAGRIERAIHSAVENERLSCRRKL